MIEAFGLEKTYGDVHAVRGLTFSVPKGEVLGLLGLNGAGKTTTIRMLTTYIPPSAGSATIGGYDLLNEPEKIRSLLGYLPENPPLYPEMRVQEYLRFVGRIRGLHGSRLRPAVERIVEQCGLNGYTKRLCGELSKGYRQRVGIAQALIHEPPLVILDEPTSGLDPVQILEVRKLIRSLRKNHTVVLSTHILREVVEVCTRIVVLANGQVADEGVLDNRFQEHELEERFLRAVSSVPRETLKVVGNSR